MRVPLVLSSPRAWRGLMTRRKLKPEDAATSIALRERLLLTISVIENVQDFPSGQQLRELVDSAGDRGDLRSLRLMVREMEAMTITLAPHERDGLEAVLKARFGVDKDAERGELRRAVAAALERGSIASEKERRRLEDYVEMLEATGGDPAEIQAVRQLIRSS